MIVSVMADSSPRSNAQSLITWLDATVVAVALAVVVGGITRLTESGLSITEWKPVSGVLPPLSTADWAAAFEGYLQIPEAQTVHKGITLGAFKALYWWEWVHRILARLVGLVIAVPYFWFLARRRLPASLRLRLAFLPVLVAAQGVLGWYMVSSGLSGRISVSQYRLVAHLALALVILVIALWTSASLRAARDGAPEGGAGAGGAGAGGAGAGGAGTGGAGTGGAGAGGALREDARPGSPPRDSAGAGWWPRLTDAFAIWTFAVILTGGFVAGLDAGKIFNTFPLMGGQWVPPAYWMQAGFLANAFENPVAAQFHHRVLAIATVLIALALWIGAKAHNAPARLLTAQRNVALVASVQVGLGIVTLLLSVPVAVAALHQLVAVAMLGAAVIAAHAARR